MTKTELMQHMSAGYRHAVPVATSFGRKYEARRHSMARVYTRPRWDFRLISLPNVETGLTGFGSAPTANLFQHHTRAVPVHQLSLV